MDVTGFILAGISMVLFGLYMVPRKLSNLRDFEFVASMGFGVLPTTIGMSLIAHRGVGGALPPAGLALAFSCGLLWIGGMLSYTLSVTQMGLALATPIKNTTAILGTAFGFAFFAEWQQTRVLPAVVGSLLVVACAVVLGQTGERRGQRSFVTPLGVAFALLAALFFAAYTVPLKYAMKMAVDSYRLIAVMGVGATLGGISLLVIQHRPLGAWLRRPSRDHFWSASAGVCWALATIAMVEAIARIGLAVTWPVTNLNTIVTVACGILLFHEVSVRKYWKTLSIGMLCAIAGAVLLGLAKS